MTQTIYSTGAAEYAFKSSTDAIYLKYERPALRRLAGAVKGLSVLDLGCGPGDHVRWLQERGAKKIVGIDESAEMIEICRKRFARAEFHRCDFSGGLAFANDRTFDLVVSSLALHYVRDWTRVLREIRRVLRSDGRFVLSTHHPFNPGILALVGDYFSTELVRDRFPIGGRDVDVEYYHRPLHAVVTAFVEAGFRIVKMAEPPYEGKPMFLFIEARNEGPARRRR